MSAVMSTLSIISGGRRAHRKLASSRKSGQLSDAGAGAADDRRDLSRQQRSASLQTLETNTAGGVVNLENLEAKMASIEVSLGGRRRRGAGGRDPMRDLDALRDALADKDTLIHSLKKQLSATLSAARLAAQTATGCDGGGSVRRPPRDSEPELSVEERRALEERAAAVRAELEERRSAIADLRRQLETTHVTDNIDTRIEQAELQYRVGREELELLSLSEQARALAALLQHADARAAAANATLYSAVLGYGGETAMVVCAEMREGTWGGAPRAGPGLYVEWVRPTPSSTPAEASAPTPGDRVLEVNGVPLVSSRSTDELERALRSTPSPARLVLLRATPQLRPRTPPVSPAITQMEVTSLRVELGSLRAAAEDAERTKESLKADNTRLTHRISYLEEQVSELLARHAQNHFSDSYDGRYSTPLSECQKNVTNISIGTEAGSNARPDTRSEVQVFQKGPDITAIVAKLPGLDSIENGLPVIGPRSSASSRASPAPPPPATPQRRSHSSHSLDHRAGRPRNSHSTHGPHLTSDYRVDTDAALRIIERNRRHIERQRIEYDGRARSAYDDLHNSCSEAEPDSAVELAERCRRDAADRIHETIKKTNWAERKTLSIIEQLKRSQRSRKAKNKNDSLERLDEESERRYISHRIDGKIIENAHKSSRRSSKMHSRSAKSSEFESECSDWPNGEEHRKSRKADYGSEPALLRLEERVSGSEAKVRPTPPRKPIRLSLHKAQSAHSLATGSEPETVNELGTRARTENASPRSTETGGKKPVKRSYGNGGDRWERFREGGRGTPRPARRLDALSACDPPPADRLYPPDVHAALASRS